MFTIQVAFVEYYEQCVASQHDKDAMHVYVFAKIDKNT